MHRRDFISVSAQGLMQAVLVGCGGGASNNVVTPPAAAQASSVSTTSGTTLVQTVQATMASKDVDLDGAGLVYEALGADNRVQSLNGSQVRWSVGGFGADNGQFNLATALNEVGGKVYVVDSGNRRVQVFDSSGNLIRVIGPFATGDPSEMLGPRDVDVDANGRIYVSDNVDSDVNVYAPDGTFLFSIASQGTEAGKLNGPSGLGLSAEGLHVVDTGNGRVNVYTLDGTFLRSYGTRGRGAGLIFWPRDIALDSQGRSYVSDPSQSQVVVFAADGSVLQSITPRLPDGRLGDPLHVAIDAGGGLIITVRPVPA